MYTLVVKWCQMDNLEVSYGIVRKNSKVIGGSMHSIDNFYEKCICSNWIAGYSVNENFGIDFKEKKKVDNYCKSRKGVKKRIIP